MSECNALDEHTHTHTYKGGCIRYSANGFAFETCNRVWLVAVHDASMDGTALFVLIELNEDLLDTHV